MSKINRKRTTFQILQINEQRCIGALFGCSRTGHNACAQGLKWSTFWFSNMRKFSFLNRKVDKFPIQSTSNCGHSHMGSFNKLQFFTCSNFAGWKLHFKNTIVLTNDYFTYVPKIIYLFRFFNEIHWHSKKLCTRILFVDNVLKNAYSLWAFRTSSSNYTWYNPFENRKFDFRWPT